MSTPERFADPDRAARALVERLEGRIRLALPLGLGKPLRLLDALYRLAGEQPAIELDIFTALTLEVPRPRSALEARFLEPLVERLFAGVSDPAYAADRRRGKLPPNVRVHEFYLRPGALLGNPEAQRRYVSSNYSHVARDVARRNINAIAQMIAPGPPDADSVYSLSCNPDLTADVQDALQASGRPPAMLVGEVNPQLPYMAGDAELEADDFDLLLDEGGSGYPLYPVPNRPVALTEQVIGARVAALVADGGTLQIGIGSLGDAIAAALTMRREDNERFRALLGALAEGSPEPELDALPEGLYGASEMFVEGFLHLREHGVLQRTVDHGVFLHAGFFLGSESFYRRLRALGPAERRGIHMSRISFTNQLLDDAERKVSQRRDARFVNTAMMMTLLGAAVSDALEDGRVVSGVGGQYDFVAMAHQLPGGRSILMLPATRVSKGRTTSNIVWNYGHTTIPRHLRDIVVTEYGVADLRGASDEEVIVALLNLADSRFQESLRRRAVAAGKLAKDYRIPARFRRNSPRVLHQAIADTGLLADLPFYPLGSDFTPEEAELAVALGALSDLQGNRRELLRAAWRGWRMLRGRGGERLRPVLERMGLARPRGLREGLYRALLAAVLVRDVHESGRVMFGSSAHAANADAQTDRSTP